GRAGDGPRGSGDEGEDHAENAGGAVIAPVTLTRCRPSVSNALATARVAVERGVMCDAGRSQRMAIYMAIETPAAAGSHVARRAGIGGAGDPHGHERECDRGLG